MSETRNEQRSEQHGVDDKTERHDSQKAERGVDDKTERHDSQKAERGIDDKTERHDSQKVQAEKSGEAPQEAAGRSVKKGGLAVVLAIVLSLLWYLVADRYTPYTNQARIEGFVVGVAPQVAGKVTKVWVTNNQEVEEGRPLFEIDPSHYQIALNKARSDLENARKQVGAGSAVVATARANLVAARANARRAQQDFTRLQRLYEQDPGTISVRRLETSRSSLDQARAQVTAAEADIQRAIEQMGGDDPDNNTILNTALTAVAKAELDLTNTVVKASSRGVITDLRAEVGQFAGTGSPVLTLIAIHDLWVNAEFTENNLGHLKVDTPVEILFDVLPGRVFRGEVRSLGLGVGAGPNPSAGNLPAIRNDRDWLRQSQRFPVIIGFDTEQDLVLREQLRIGGQASVIAYSEGTWFLKLLGKAYIRLASWLSYIF
jgi:multidrug resistance efflux pump